jgi:hypothetical protein
VTKRISLIFRIRETGTCRKGVWMQVAGVLMPEEQLAIGLIIVGNQELPQRTQRPQSHLIDLPSRPSRALQ